MAKLGLLLLACVPVALCGVVQGGGRLLGRPEAGAGPDAPPPAQAEADLRRAAQETRSVLGLDREVVAAVVCIRPECPNSPGAPGRAIAAHAAALAEARRFAEGFADPARAKLDSFTSDQLREALRERQGRAEKARQAWSAVQKDYPRETLYELLRKWLAQTRQAGPVPFPPDALATIRRGATAMKQFVHDHDPALLPDASVPAQVRLWGDALEAIGGPGLATANCLDHLNAVAAVVALLRPAGARQDLDTARAAVQALCEGLLDKDLPRDDKVVLRVGEGSQEVPRKEVYVLWKGKKAAAALADERILKDRTIRNNVEYFSYNRRSYSGDCDVEPTEKSRAADKYNEERKKLKDAGWSAGAINRAYEKLKSEPDKRHLAPYWLRLHDLAEFARRNQSLFRP